MGPILAGAIVKIAEAFAAKKEPPVSRETTTPALVDAEPVRPRAKPAPSPEEDNWKHLPVVGGEGEAVAGAVG